MSLTCLGTCVFQNFGTPPPPLGFALTNPNFPTLAAGALLPVKPNSFLIVGWPDNAVPPQYPNGVPNFLPLQPWPPNPGWPGQDTTPVPPATTGLSLQRSPPPQMHGFVESQEPEPEPSSSRRKK